MRHSELFEAIFGEKYIKETYKPIAHSWRYSKILRKQYCKNCGLIHSKNKFTKWAVDKGCLNDLHSSYKSKRRKL